MMQLEHVTKAWLDKAITAAKKKIGLPSLAKNRFERYGEGRCVRIVYMGPYAAETPTLRVSTSSRRRRANSLRGKHQEIHLGDSRRTALEKMRMDFHQAAKQSLGNQP
jgi:hypothetical protein